MRSEPGYARGESRERVMRDAELDKLWMKKLTAVAHMVMAIDAGAGCKGLEEGRLTSIKFLLPSQERGDCLLVIKAVDEHGDHVGFVGGPDVATILLTWRKKEAAQGLTYREDAPYDV